MGTILQMWNVIYSLFLWAWNWSIPDTDIHPIQLSLTVLIIDVTLEAIVPIIHKSAASAAEKGED